MATLAAYYDESFEDQCYTISGYLSDHSTWLHLDWRWRELLEKWKIKYFKASECETLVGEFLKYRTNPGHPRKPMTDGDKVVSRQAKTDFVDAICKFESSLCGIGITVELCRGGRC